MNVSQFYLSLPTIQNMMSKRFVLGIFLCAVVNISVAQVGGNSIYPILNHSYSARINGLGGGLIAVHNDDPTMILYNPSSISDRFHTSFTADYVDYFSNVAYGSAIYSHSFKRLGSFALGFQYVGYGTFNQTDEVGNVSGTFTAGDYVATLGWGRKLDSSFSIGANLKYIYSGLETYTSQGIAADVSGTYYNPDRKVSISLLFKNMGSQLTTYTPGNFEPLPFDIQLAFSKQLEHLPARFHISLHSLYKWKMGYVGADDPLLEVDALTGEPKYPSVFSQGVKNFFRHINFGVEILPSPAFSIFASFNYNRNQEMLVPQRKSAAGFSYGFAFNIKAFQIGFSMSHYAVGAAPMCFNFSTNFEELFHSTKTKQKLKRVNPQI